MLLFSYLLPHCTTRNVRELEHVVRLILPKLISLIQSSGQQHDVAHLHTLTTLLAILQVMNKLQAGACACMRLSCNCTRCWSTHASKSLHRPAGGCCHAQRPSSLLHPSFIRFKWEVKACGTATAPPRPAPLLRLCSYELVTSRCAMCVLYCAVMWCIVGTVPRVLGREHLRHVTIAAHCPLHWKPLLLNPFLFSQDELVLGSVLDRSFCSLSFVWGCPVLLFSFLLLFMSCCCCL